jgi:hypothetical protein
MRFGRPKSTAMIDHGRVSPIGLKPDLNDCYRAPVGLEPNLADFQSGRVVTPRVQPDFTPNTLEVKIFEIRPITWSGNTP